MKKTIGMIVVALFAGLAANATVVTLAPDADVDIRSADLADIGYNREGFYIANLNADPSAARNGKAYLRFKLPVDFNTATSATFTMTRTAVGSWDPTYNVSGLNDGIAGEADWSDANNSSGTTWNNAPGNIIASANEFSDSVLVGSFQVFRASSGGFVGDTHSVSGTNLVDFLNADANGYVTLMVGRMGGTSSSSDGWAASEHPTNSWAPTLELEYTPIGSATVVLAPDADADIRSTSASEDIGYNRENLSVANLNADPSAERDAKAYLRFKLPTDFHTALSATFTITRATIGAWNPTYDVNGLNDGVAGETDWIEANGYGMNWNNAPGNITTSANEFTNAVLVGSFPVKSTANGGFIGDSHTVSGTALVDFLNADANGYVTLMIGRMGGPTASSDSFASRTHPTNSWAPTLTLQYAVLPAYEAWIGQYPGVGSATNLTDNPDSDSLDNLAEWALGGNPDDANDRGHAPAVATTAEGGTNWLEYVYAKRNNAAALGLSYYLEQGTDLVFPSWTNDNYEVGDTGVLDGEFDTVTNRIPTDSESKQFLRLRIESN